MVSIDDLVRLVPPPANPVASDGDWGRVEAALGLRLPTDFKDLVRRYGYGQFDDISLWTPFQPSRPGVPDLVARAHNLLDLYQSLREVAPEDFPHPLYPEPGGLLEWAGTGDGDQLCWLTVGEPDDWPVVVWNIRESAQRHDMGVVEFLHGYLGGRLEVEMLRPPPAVPWFDPHRERTEVYIRLSEGAVPYEERLRILREVLSPTVDRGGYDDGDGVRQDHFKALDRDWLLMYENCYGHQIRVAFPPEDGPTARHVMLAAVRAMGCRVLSTETAYGPSTWPDDIA